MPLTDASIRILLERLRRIEASGRGRDLAQGKGRGFPDFQVCHSEYAGRCAKPRAEFRPSHFQEIRDAQFSNSA
ncbi:MAG: hypothetical protein LBO00_01260 [Zoogloeaceae bacterium]|nr:hypothetical protein [Zoogloeaceae bacterium]